MSGVIVCHGSAGVRDRIVAAAHGVPSLAPARAAATAEELVALVRRTAPALVLLDAHLPGVGAVEALRRIRGLGADATVIMLAVPGDEITLDRAMALGARGYLPPDVDRSELAAVVAHGLSAVPQQAQVTPPGLSDSATGATATRTRPAPTGELTRRELEVLSGMSHGRSNAQIGADLFLSEDTVKTHARRLFRKLGASDRAQAVAIGLRTGLIS
ncbi:response regulator transcription factor [Isoptericola sp. b441]|uniref:Response regulator transcription factor n=1 Tax=Actinotalea lenta TaxID=3064654 RepID=A0ABT9D4T5_9CELL|nr:MULTISPECIES: response regulator transcription factor [unclassified Isoptericola]MDO8105663.1 response regulator transcription factor [Isoptericola sp. b441]MDO8122368.1 response regulator transcription factor [Isoptericola sp. b490]